jgi:hypothetical protein
MFNRTMGAMGLGASHTHWIHPKQGSKHNHQSSGARSGEAALFGQFDEASIAHEAHRRRSLHVGTGAIGR